MRNGRDMKYRRKTYFIDAEQFRLDRDPWPKDVYSAEFDVPSTQKKFGPYYYLTIQPTGLRIAISPGDWIITILDGTKEVMNNDDFNKRFEIYDKWENRDD